MSSDSASASSTSLQRKVSTPTRRQYNHDCEREPELKGWLAPNPAGIAKGKGAKCTVCNLGLRIHHGDLVKHGTKCASHQANMKLLQSNQQQRLDDVGEGLEQKQ